MPLRNTNRSVRKVRIIKKSGEIRLYEALATPQERKVLIPAQNGNNNSKPEKMSLQVQQLNSASNDKSRGCFAISIPSQLHTVNMRMRRSLRMR